MSSAHCQHHANSTSHVRAAAQEFVRTEGAHKFIYSRLNTEVVDCSRIYHLPPTSSVTTTPPTGVRIPRPSKVKAKEKEKGKARAKQKAKEKVRNPTGGQPLTLLAKVRVRALVKQNNPIILVHLPHLCTLGRPFRGGYSTQLSTTPPAFALLAVI